MADAECASRTGPESLFSVFLRRGSNTDGCSHHCRVEPRHLLGRSQSNYVETFQTAGCVLLMEVLGDQSLARTRLSALPGPPGGGRNSRVAKTTFVLCDDLLAGASPDG